MKAILRHSRVGLVNRPGDPGGSITSVGWSNGKSKPVFSGSA
jgi:hypothetical protein